MLLVYHCLLIDFIIKEGLRPYVLYQWSPKLLLRSVKEERYCVNKGITLFVGYGQSSGQCGEEERAAQRSNKVHEIQNIYMYLCMYHHDSLLGKRGDGGSITLTP